MRSSLLLVLVALLGALVFAELGSCFPTAGGQYTYLLEAFGKLPAFLFGWGFSSGTFVLRDLGDNVRGKRARHRVTVVVEHLHLERGGALRG
ncbi:MAG: amino acid permease [Alcanivorax sp.]|nr:amino acid permease [Alcanivorax sp.]